MEAEQEDVVAVAEPHDGEARERAFREPVGALALLDGDPDGLLLARGGRQPAEVDRGERHV